ncbi:MAG: hypothetical protein EXX96DRAFT_613890 [Benjaminiella poitrasii]|nr:MAG: hypothetical protein EXX96DRAFT_613890 [Benjaminiella poitrasii]
MANQDYYSLLGVSKHATDSEIKKAYRQQALRFHPDRNKDESAKCQFQKISEAFEVLSDDKKRCQYDIDGSHCVWSSTESSALNPEELFAHFFPTAPSSPSSSSISSDEDDFFDFLNHIRHSPPATSQKPRSVKRSLPVSLDDLYTGTVKRLKVTRTLPDKTTAHKILSVHIKPGSKQGTKIHFPGEGDCLPSGQNQDIEFEIQEKPHTLFTRKGDNLHTTLQISLLEALTGFEKTIQKLDGSPCTISSHHCIIQSGQEEILIGEGMPNELTGEKGDMIVQFQVQFPRSLSEEQCKALRNVLA